LDCKTWMHKINGLTERDVILAAKIDAPKVVKSCGRQDAVLLTAAPARFTSH
jgi:hypothetical protein